MREFVLAHDGRVCDIVINAAAPTAAGAAAQLTRWLQAICGVQPQVVTGEAAAGAVCLGFADEAFGVDALRLRIADDRLYLDGGARGLVYAVYELLERLGCRFLTKDCEVLPKTDRLVLTLEADVQQSPVFEYRDTHWNGATIDFKPRLRLNGAHGDDRIPTELGGDVHYAGFVHTLGQLAEMEGEVTDRQPCLSDEKVFDTVVKNLRARLAQDPTAAIASVSQNDSHDWGRGCQCAACRALDEAEGTPMGSLLTFVNKVADTIAPEAPQVAIDTLAYRYTRKAPAHLRARDNVIVRLCSIECCFSHPIESCDAALEGVEDGGFAATLRRWAQHSGRIYIWDYTTNFRNYNASFPNFGVLRQNVRFFAENQVRGVFEQGNRQSTNGEFGELRTYLLAKLLWDPYMSEETYQRHMDEFLAGYYGSGAPALRRFIDRLQRAAQSVHMGIYYQDPAEMFVDPDTTGDHLARAQAFLQKGRADFAEAMAAAADETQRRRIRKAEIQLDVYEWYCRNMALQALAADDPARPAAEQAVRDAGQALLDITTAFGITHMHESGYKGNSFAECDIDLLTQPAFWGD